MRIYKAAEISKSMRTLNIFIYATFTDTLVSSEASLNQISLFFFLSLFDGEEKNVSFLAMRR